MSSSFGGEGWTAGSAGLQPVEEMDDTYASDEVVWNGARCMG